MTGTIEHQAARVLEAAGTLALGEVRTVAPVPGGGNNRLFRVEGSDGVPYALKTYDMSSGEGAGRAQAEFRALSFLWAHGLRAVPRPLAIDPARGLALFDWVEGAKVTAPTAEDAEAAIEFLGQLRRLASSNAAALPEAKEACFSAAQVAAQIECRLDRLHAAAAGRHDLGHFIDDGFREVLGGATRTAREGYRRAGLDFEAPIAPAHRTLSPSDFGFHNALKRRDGDLVFLDFEYFGWDDPAKLISDFLLHPGMHLDDRAKRLISAGADRVFAGDAQFATRLRLLYPLFGLRWCLILLNEFLDEGWRRRAYAGAQDRGSALESQLSKARGLLGRIAAHGGGFPYDA